MTNSLTTKEKMLLQDLKTQEEICIQKYQSYAEQTQSSQLKQIFTDHGQQEQNHLNTLNQIMSGQVPSMAQGGSQQQGQQQPLFKPQFLKGNQLDSFLCTDLLSTEKHVSGTYDTAIFEFTNPQVRQALNHIQKEEQQHGEDIFLYMQSNGMYNPQ